MTAGSDHTNPRWVAALFTALPILLSILYAVVAGGSSAKTPAKNAPTTAVASR